MLIVYLIALIIGFVALIKGADIFVSGSSALARRFRVPSLIIGLTIVAIGTSAPELAVSVSAAMQGANEIALSNVVGSNIFNLLVVVGIIALIDPLHVDSAVLKRDLPFSILISVFVFLALGGISALSRSVDMAQAVGAVSRPVGAVLLAMFAIYTVYLIVDAKKHKQPEAEGEKPMPFLKSLALIVLGIGLIVGGGQAVVYGARKLAALFGMSETLIGLTVVAIGTSLPELVTSIVAARKGETGLAVGNVVGSCIFNFLLILGLSAAISPFPVNLASVYDLAILIFSSALTLVFALTSKTVRRSEGVIMLTLYAAAIVFAVIR